MKVVAFNGSPRKNGNTSLLIKHAFSTLEESGIECELIQIGGEIIRGCTACSKCKENKDQRCVIEDDIVNQCIQKMIDADGIIIASPTYFADVTPETKALIDRAGYVARANDSMLKMKIGAAIVAVRRAGSIHAFDSINHFFLINEMVVVGSSYWNIGIGHDIREVNLDDEGVETMLTLGENMAWLLQKLKGKK